MLSNTKGTISLLSTKRYFNLLNTFEYEKEITLTCLKNIKYFIAPTMAHKEVIA